MRLLRRGGLRAKRVGVSEIVGVLLMVVITVAAALMIVVYIQSLYGTLTAGGVSTHVTVNGEMAVPGVYDSSGVLTISLRNGGSRPITGITVNCPTSYFSAANCITFSIPTGVAVGASASASGVVLACSGSPPGCLANSFTAGTSYALIVTATFVGGSIQAVALTVTSAS